jgi:hypothetical protein
MSDFIKLYFPRWLFPNNLGDSLILTFVPKILKQQYPNKKIEVITYGFLVDLLKLDKNVDVVRQPFENEIYLNYKDYAFSNNQNENVKVVYPDWHPKVFSFWKENHEILESHSNVNIIVLNYLLQLGLEKLIFTNTDFSTYANTPIFKNETQYINVGIVPATKLSGKKTPHPNCDGLGFRFNGQKGLNSWKKLVETLKNKNSNIKIYEFSSENFGLGDYHLPDTGNIFDLLKNVDIMDYGIMSDGGVHHAFNLRKKPIVLFQAGILCKVEFLKLGNAFYPEHLHLDCRKKCPSFFFETFGGENLSLTCKRECENMSAEALGNYFLKKVLK